ncbi:MAG: hypothetical protein B9S34_02925 [Opitutia bacterium Tous-C1TDCM]|nr:MAG: hypothetical protein B9S34_02925 [Opitutae bacterium Tous-C1TDCM]
MVLPRSLPLLAAGLFAAGPAVAAGPDFNREIRPILSENCFACHGQDPARREGKLRLDEREGAVAVRDGIAAVVPGRPDESELLRRLASTDATEAMPPPEAHKTVTPAQREVLRAWIAAGAPYARHWAFVPPQREPLPAVRQTAWPRQPLDRFVLARLEAENLAPAPEAAPATWLRRAALDLTGLPPTPAELDAFAADVRARGEAAYAAAADRLLASPHYGERQAIEWLDAARYADTHGFNNDSTRTMWRWRDWVIEAFNTNLPYDRFIAEQLAGDLLPQPTLEQRIATGFGRNHVINSEGGIIDEEYRVEYVADRVRTLSTAWLGLTMECARCHDHKFDPIAQRDYYRLAAFFNNVPEFGEDGRVANAVPMIPAPTRAQQQALREWESEAAAAAKAVDALAAGWTWSNASAAALPALAAEARARAAALNGCALLETERSGPGLVDEVWRPAADAPAPRIEGSALDFAGKAGATVAFWLRPEAGNPSDVPLLSALNHVGSPADSQYGKGRELRLIDGELELRLSERYPVYAVVVRSVGAQIRPDEWRHVAVAYAGGKAAAAVRMFVDGREIGTRVLHDGLSGEPPRRDFLVGADNAPDGRRWRGAFDDLTGFARALAADEIRAQFAAAALPYAAARRADGTARERELGWLRDALLGAEPTGAAALARRTRVAGELLALQRSLPTAMVMAEMATPRPARVLGRGQYDGPGEAVDAGVPERLLAPWPVGAPRNRLGLAQWLTQPDHPLTARVVVNRFWAQLFGTGLVKTLEDFGSQSEWPSHPGLLDHLATEFVGGRWNVKRWLRTVVLSATYRQSSAVSPALAARDPENRLLARGPRVRLPAELIRDQALAVSGLLVPTIGGPSVFPYQPEKLYDGIVVGANYPGTKWVESQGADRYRRSLYTFWKRTVPHPAMTTFDAPDREFCTVRRARTNTPLQALALWNEPGYFEAARRLGVRLLQADGADDAAKAEWGFRTATGRAPRPEETAVLVRTWQTLRRDYAANPDDAAKLLQVGAAPPEPGIPLPEQAAAAAVASMLLSLDETITKN